MKKLFLSLLFSIMIANAWAQKATINFEFLNLPDSPNRLTVYNMLGFSLSRPESILLNPDKTGRCSYEIDLEKPQFLKLGFVIDELNANYISYLLFLTPGDKLTFKADFSAKDGKIEISGKGSENNQPSVQGLTNIDLHEMAKDTLPNRTTSAINAQQVQNRKALDRYVSKFHPSVAFIREANINLRYFPAQTFYNYKEDNKYFKGEAYLRNFNLWENAMKGYFKSAPVNNDAALSAYNYILLITRFILRENERAMESFHNDKPAFLKAWAYPLNSSVNPFDKENKYFFQAKLINKYFTGRTAEFLHAKLIKASLSKGFNNKSETLFKQFVKDYPKSGFTKFFTEDFSTIAPK